jgi:hypothetical protein
MEQKESDEIKSFLEGGFVDAGRHRLEELLKVNPHDMQAWLMYVNTFKTVDTRIEVLDICQRLNPDNLKVKTALSALKLKKSADHVPVPRTVTPPSQPKPAGQTSDWRDDQRIEGDPAAELASNPQPSASAESAPAWGYETSARDMYGKPPASLSKEEINRQARDYVEGGGDGKKEHQTNQPAPNSRSIPKWGVILGIILVVLILACLFIYLGITYLVP